MSEQIVTAKEEDDKLLVNYYQDVEPILEIAKRERRVDAEERTAFGKRGEFRRVMTVPMNVMMAVAAKLGIPAGEMLQSEHSKRIMAELKGPDFKLFRTVGDKRI